SLYLELSSPETIDRVAVSVLTSDDFLVRDREFPDAGKKLTLPGRIRIDMGRRTDTVCIPVEGYDNGSLIARGETVVALVPGQHVVKKIMLTKAGLDTPVCEGYGPPPVDMTIDAAPLDLEPDLQPDLYPTLICDGGTGLPAGSTAILQLFEPTGI